MNKWLHILSVYVSIILLCNIIGYAYLNFVNPELYRNGLVIKFKPYAWAFVHGAYYDSNGWCGETQYEQVNGSYFLNRLNLTCIIYSGATHYTTYKGVRYTTEQFVTDLYNQGYTHIWTTACHTGDSEYISNYTTKLEQTIVGWTTITTGPPHLIEWPNWVDRVRAPGKVYPIFVGLGFIRISMR
jgi:hypothetical protein